MKNTKFAFISGISLILMALVAGFSIGYGFNEFYNLEQIDNFKTNLLENKSLYQYMIFGIVIIIILDFLVSYTLYAYFKSVNNSISLVSGVSRLFYTIIFGYATFYLVNNLTEDNLTNEIIKNNYELFQSTWYFGLIIFGVHLFLIGYLMKLHNRIPKLLSYLAIIAGISYIFVHIFLLISPNSEFVDIMQMVLGLPMALGELLLAIWLLVKGRKE